MAGGLRYYLCYVLLVSHAYAAVTPSNRGAAASTGARTFGQVSAAIGGELSTATLEMLNHLKDRKISLIVEQPWEGNKVYEETANKIAREYPHSVVSVAYVKNSILYSVEDDAGTVSDMIKDASEKSTLTLLVMSMRLAKECLVAAHDLGLHKGTHAFIVYEYHVLNMLSYHKRPFKWAMVSYTTDSDESFTQFLSRSRKLCWMLERIFIVMVTLPEHLMTVLKERVPKLYRNDRKVRVHNLDMWSRGGAEATTFTTRGDYRTFLNEQGVPKYPLAVYRYGMKNGDRAGARCASLLSGLLAGGSTGGSGESDAYPMMHKVASFALKQDTNEEWSISFRRKASHKASSFRSLKLSAGSSEKPCSSGDRNCRTVMVGKVPYHAVEVLLVVCVVLVLLLLVFVIYRLYVRDHRKVREDGKCLIPIPTNIRVLDSEDDKHGAHV